MFSASLFEFTRAEHSPVWTSVTTLQASDSDEGTNALITYSIDQRTLLDHGTAPLSVAVSNRSIVGKASRFKSSGAEVKQF